MIKFFRKIRQKMIKENRASKYILYAVGEIVLVVIGILIALQINDWKQISENRTEESKLLDAFQEEFLQNKESLTKIKFHFSEITKANKLLMELIGKNPSHIQKFNVDSLLSVSINFDNYNPSNYVLNNMTSTGKLKLVSSEKLRINLYEWNQEIGQKENSYEMLYKYFMESLIPYLSKNTSLKNINLYATNGFISKPSELSHNSIEMFQNLEFENHLDNYYYTVTLFMESLSRLENVINQIIIETEKK